jgi:hypothetical protein
MILFQTEIDDFHSPAIDEYETHAKEERTRSEAKAKIKAEKWAQDRINFESMLPLMKELEERHKILERANEIARADYTYWENN